MEKTSRRGYAWEVSLQVICCLAAVFQLSTAQSCPIGCSRCSTTVVNCASIGLSSFPQLSLELQRSVQTLDLHNNMIEVLEPNVLENYISLRYISLLNNRLTALPEELFNATTQLQYLYLSINQLTALPERLFSATPQLIDVYLHHNNLTELPEGLFNYTTQLEQLWLYDNQLTSLPEGIFNATTQLRDLRLHYNQLTGLPEGLFTTTTQLQQLFIYSNPWHCNCYLRWLPAILANVTENILATCATPADLNGVSIVSLEENQLVCNPSGSCSITYPIQSSEQSEECPSKLEGNSVREMIRADVRARVHDTVLPFLQGAVEYCPET